MKRKALALLVFFAMPAVALAAPGYGNNYRHNKHHTNYTRPATFGAAAALATGIIALKKPHGERHHSYYDNRSYYDHRSEYQRREYQRYLRAQRERRQRAWNRRNHTRRYGNYYNYNCR